MNEKRFEASWNMHRTLHYSSIIDKENKKVYCVEQYHTDVEKVVDLLNEQQSTIEQLQAENKELKHWKKRMIEYLSDWFEKTEYLSVLYKIAEITNELGFDGDE